MKKLYIPFGPYHPALEEPFKLDLDLEGERVKSARVRVGYNHKGIEYLLERRRYHECLRLVERVCSICTQSHSQCFVQGVEKLARIDVPDRALYIRTVVFELNRIESHLLLLGVASHLAGFDTLFMYTWYAREHVMDILEVLTGNRVQYAINTLGGVRRDIDEKTAKFVLEKLDSSLKWLDKLKKVFVEDPTLKARTKEIGVLSKDDARKLCVVGPVLRASGVEWDIRRVDPYLVYDRLDFNIIVADEGDVFSRLAVRLLEVYESARIIRQAIKDMPSGDIRVPIEHVAEGEVISRVEAPRGELLYYIRSNGSNTPERVKIRTPTIPNLYALEYMIPGHRLADVPLITGSIDPCLSCTDR